MTERPGIYAIQHTATGRCYVGSASNISKRWSRHRKDLRAGSHRNAHLQAAWTRYGEDAFAFIVLEFDPVDLTVAEQRWMDDLDVVANGFNIAPVARSSRGRPHPEAQRESARRTVGRLNTPEMIERRRVMLRERNKATAVVSDQQADEIRVRRAAGERTSDLAREFAVCPPTICDIVSRRTHA